LRRCAIMMTVRPFIRRRNASITRCSDSVSNAAVGQPGRLAAVVASNYAGETHEHLGVGLAGAILLLGAQLPIGGLSDLVEAGWPQITRQTNRGLSPDRISGEIVALLLCRFERAS
jgi:hypothetical protein